MELFTIGKEGRRIWEFLGGGDWESFGEMEF
jgi:hypothetical protein